MPKSCIPGYEDALKEERGLRLGVFLGVNPKICGVEIREITPRLLALLLCMETPFICGGEYDNAHTLSFLWAMSPQFVRADHPEHNERVEALTATLRKSLGDAFTQAEDEIDAFIFNTFLDGPQSGGADSKPYVTGVAWMLYTMAKEPFVWDTERTLDTPIRIIHQLQRCKQLDGGSILYNEISDTVSAKWLDAFRLANNPTGQN